MILRFWQPEPDENWQPQEERVFDSAQSLNHPVFYFLLARHRGRVVICLYCLGKRADVESKLRTDDRKSKMGEESVF